jgi:hypothetical protein
MTAIRTACAGAFVLASLIAFGVWKPLGEANAREGGSGQVPRFVVDPYWPKPVAQRWVTGEVAGTCIEG